jgi:diadenosine tetraphosphatase ApaH/serine/threonine PP2A family protein phosphatase
MLWRPEMLAAFADQVPQLKPLMTMISEMAIACTAAIGPERLQWLTQLPHEWSDHGVTVVHAAPGDLWRAPMPGATDSDLLKTYGPLRTPRVVYGHIHVPYVRPLPTLTVANSGSVGMPYDGDPRAAYLLLDDDEIVIRRVEYDIEREAAELVSRKLPHADWLAAMLRTGKYQPPA